MGVDGLGRMGVDGDGWGWMGMDGDGWGWMGMGAGWSVVFTCIIL
jgi:hypothetical protein